MPSKHKYLVVICGATASGKTGAAIRLAEHYGTEILSTDSRQIYREMNIGTGKPREEDLSRIRHHFISTISIHEEYSAGRFERDALALLEKLYETHDVVIAAGGTGLYSQALTRGFEDIPPADPAIREALLKEYEAYGLEYLQQEAGLADPDSYSNTDKQNPRRLIRLLEVFRATGKPRSWFISGGKPADRNFTTIKIGLDVDRRELYERINSRVDEMMEQGLLEEVEQLHPFRDLNSLQTVGYAELMEYLDGSVDLSGAVALIKRNSRRYAKRQLTWFRKDAGIKWFEPRDISGMISHIDGIAGSAGDKSDSA